MWGGGAKRSRATPLISQGRARDVPEIGAVEPVGVAGRLVRGRGVERAEAIGPHLAAVGAGDDGEIALGRRVGGRGQGRPALGAFGLAGRFAAAVTVER